MYLKICFKHLFCLLLEWQHKTEWLWQLVTKTKETHSSDIEKQIHQENNAISFDKFDIIQAGIVKKVMTVIRLFMKCDSFQQFKTLRMIIKAMAGWGKSEVIKVNCKVMLQIFNDNNYVMPNTPTVLSTYNTNGETCHRSWGVPYVESFEISAMLRKRFIKRIKHILVLMVNECSLFDAENLENIHRNTQETFYYGANKHKHWGGIPQLWSSLTIITSCFQFSWSFWINEPSN